MKFSEYQTQSRVTATYPSVGENFTYPTLGLAGETGEVVEKIKKLMRNEQITSASEIEPEKLKEIEKEMGDVLWYMAQLATELGISLDDVAELNLEKLLSRMDRGVLHSAGDNR